MDKKTLAKFRKFADDGIQTKEVEAAKVCLTRELGRVPALQEVVEFLEQYMLWRRNIRMWKNGEIIMKIEYTRRGKAVKGTVSKVNNIFHRYFKQKGGEK